VSGKGCAPKGGKAPPFTPKGDKTKAPKGGKGK
jgi:hypothetical protein